MKRLLVMLCTVALVFNSNAQEECMNPDINCDGYVNVNDLLGLLGYFGDEDLDGDGIWDSQDDCVEDECGVCDGPGPQVLAVDTITFTVDSIFVEAINEWYVFEVPDTTFTFVCTNPGCTDPMADNYDPYASEDDGSCSYPGPLECGGASTVTFDGYTYDLVAIGDQCWFAENLRTEHYTNGDAIPANLYDSEWSSTTSGAVTVYGEGTSSVQSGSDDEESNLIDYGRLYNWYAVIDERGLCPDGWHVPTDEEYMALEIELGMSESEANGTGYRGTDQGAQMKSSSEDIPSWSGTNISGFSALAGGFRNSYGDFREGGVEALFWTYPSQTSDTWSRRLHSNNDAVRRNLIGEEAGASVRCLKDTE